MSRPNLASIAPVIGLVLAATLACKKDEKSPAAASASAAAQASGAPKPPQVPFEEKVKASKPIVVSPVAQTVAGKKLEAQPCKLGDKSFLSPNASSTIQAIEIVGDQLLVADHEGLLHGFKVSTAGGCTLSVDASFGNGGVLKLPNKIEHLSKTDSGLVVAASGVFESYVLDHGKKLFDCKASGHFEVEPGGKWGIVPWVNSTVELVELSKDSCKSQEWVLKNLSDDAKRQGFFKNVNTSAVIGDKIYMGGIPAAKINDGEPRIVVIYDKAGKELGRFGSTDKSFGDDSFGWIHGISACGKNVCAVDGNFRRMSVWSTDGKFIGAVKLATLFGLPAPVAWINDIAQAKDGAVFIPAAQERGASGVSEGLVFRVTGL